MPLLKTYDLFISHAWKYNNEYYNLTELLKECNYFKFRNYSVPEHDPIEFKTKMELSNQLEEQIRQSSVVLLISGMYVKYRPWIKKEIEFAKKYNKPIIAIIRRGAVKIPTEVELNATKIVGWNTASIVSAIREVTK